MSSVVLIKTFGNDVMSPFAIVMCNMYTDTWRIDKGDLLFIYVEIKLKGKIYSRGFVSGGKLLWIVFPLTPPRLQFHLCLSTELTNTTLKKKDFYKVLVFYYP